MRKRYFVAVPLLAGLFLPAAAAEDDPKAALKCSSPDHLRRQPVVVALTQRCAHKWLLTGTDVGVP
jgi:hypothetical protein